MAYIGNPIVSTDFPKDTFTGNASTTAFTMSIAPASVNAVIVIVSGVTQDPSTYTISGTTLTFSTAPPSGTSNISVRHLGVAGIPNTPSAASVVATSIADGVITSAKFASGQTPTFNGIAFPATQVPSADANTLDDYEEGTWTATLIGQTTAPTTPVTTSGKYVKIGKQVLVTFGFSNVDTTGASGPLVVTGLPFANDGGIALVGCPPMLYSLPASGNYNVWYIVSGQLHLYHISNNAGWNQESISAGTGKYVWATVTYITG